MSESFVECMSRYGENRSAADPSQLRSQNLLQDYKYFEKQAEEQLEEQLASIKKLSRSFIGTCEAFSAQADRAYANHGVGALDFDQQILNYVLNELRLALKDIQPIYFEIITRCVRVHTDAIAFANSLGDRMRRERTNAKRDPNTGQRRRRVLDIAIEAGNYQANTEEAWTKAWLQTEARKSGDYISTPIPIPPILSDIPRAEPEPQLFTPSARPPRERGRGTRRYG